MRFNCPYVSTVCPFSTADFLSCLRVSYCMSVSFQWHSLMVSEWIYSSCIVIHITGAHTIGQARCLLFRASIYNESNINAAFATSAKAKCPSAGGDNNLSPFDVATLPHSTTIITVIWEAKRDFCTPTSNCLMEVLQILRLLPTAPTKTASLQTLQLPW